MFSPTYQDLNFDNPSACLEVVRSGKVVFRKVEEGGEFSLGQKAQPEFGVPDILPGTDITGSGDQNMIASYYSGGAHCCTSFLLFELEPRFKLLVTLEAGDNDGTTFKEIHKAELTISSAWMSPSYIGTPALRTRR